MSPFNQRKTTEDVTHQIHWKQKSKKKNIMKPSSPSKSLTTSSSEPQKERIFDEKCFCLEEKSKCSCPICGSEEIKPWIECGKCKRWFHQKCAKLPRIPERDEKWLCEMCKSDLKSKLSPKIECGFFIAKDEISEEEEEEMEKAWEANVKTKDTLKLKIHVCPICNTDLIKKWVQCGCCGAWFHQECAKLADSSLKQLPLPKSEHWICLNCKKSPGSLKRSTSSDSDEMFWEG